MNNIYLVAMFIGVAIMLINTILIYRVNNNLKGVNMILNKMAKIKGVPEPSEDNELKMFLASNEKTKAIKRYRELTGADLKEANDYIEKILK